MATPRPAEPQPPSPSPAHPFVELAVPGPWHDREAAMRTVLERSGTRIVIAGDGLVDLARGLQATCEITGRHESLGLLFELGGQLDDDALDAIGTHATVLYVRTRGGREAARNMLQLGCDLLDAGGLGVRVETSGRTHSPAQWRELAAEADADDPATRALALYRAFIVLTGPDDEDEDEGVEDGGDEASTDEDEIGDFASCGMHALGYRDAIVADRDDMADDPIDVLEQFLLYQLIDEPTLREGDGFRLAVDAPRYVLHAEPDRRFEGADDPFHNPLGLWRLQPAG